MNTQQMIQRYAQLMATVERGAAHGRQAPPQVLDEMNRLYSRAAAVLSPQEQQQALAAVDAMKAQYHHQFQLQDHHAAQRDALYHTDKLAKDATGLSYDQMLAASRGEKFARKGKADNLKAYENKVRAVSKSLGKPDWSRKQFEQVVDRYAELKTMRGQDRAQDFLAAEFGQSAAHAKRVIEDYESSGIGLTVGLAERRGVDPDHYIEPTEDLQLRSQIAEAWAETAYRDPSTREHLASTDRINPSYLEEDEGGTPRSDIAKAMQQAELQQERAERNSYAPENYTIEDEDDVRISAY